MDGRAMPQRAGQSHDALCAGKERGRGLRLGLQPARALRPVPDRASHSAHRDMTMPCNSAWGCLLSGGLLVCGTLASAATEGNGGGANTIFHATAHDALYDIAFEGRNGIAVGAFGIVLTSEDGGSTWLRQWTAPDALALLGVAMRAGKCVIVGQMGSVFTADGCRQWKPAAAVTKARLGSGSVNRRGGAYAGRGVGAVVQSRVRGQHW